ncbi:hypothetical protein AB1N83_002547 [Pleurotus pulmonarius]
MKEDQRQGIIEGERRKAVAPSNLARPRASPDGQDRERKTSAPTQSNVGIDNGRCRSGSITLDGIHVREQVSLPVTNTSSTKLPSQHTVPGIAVAAEPPSNGTTQPGSERPAIVDAARLEDPFQSKKMSHEPRPVQREQHTYSGSPRSVNRVSMDTQEAQAPKNTDRRRIPKMILAFFGKRKSPVKSTTSVPNEPTDIDTVGRAIQEEDDQHLSMPSIVHASGKLRQIEPESRSKEVNDSDDDNASFFSAKSSKDDDFYASPAASTSLPFPIADANHEFHLERSLSLTNVGAVADLPHNDAAEIRLSSSLSASVATSFGAPGIDLDGGREVLIESGIVEVIMDDSSSSVSSSGRMLASLQSSGELDTVQEASSSVTGETSLIACDEDLVSPLAEGKALIQSAIPELGNDQSLLFPRTLNSKNIEVNSARQTVGKDTPLADVGLSHLPVPGDTSRVVCTEVGIMHESSVAQEKLVIASTSINAQDAGLRMAVAANPLPDSAMRPELVPLPSDEMDLMDVPENPVHSVVLEQTIRDVESQVVVQSSIPRPDAIRVDEKSQLPPSSEDLPVGSVNSVQELATSLLQANHIDLISTNPQPTGQDINATAPLSTSQELSAVVPLSISQDINAAVPRSTGQGINAPAPLSTACHDINPAVPLSSSGEESLPPQPNANEPSNVTSYGASVQQPLHTTSRVENPAPVREPSDMGVEMLQQFLQMAERLSSQSNGSMEGASERPSAPQVKPVNFVINFTNNNISTVAHGSGGDNYYGPIGQSAIGGQGGTNDIANFQTKELAQTTQSTQLGNTVKAH